MMSFWGNVVIRMIMTAMLGYILIICLQFFGISYHPDALAFLCGTFLSAVVFEALTRI